LGSRIREARLLQPCLASGVPAELRVFWLGKPVTCIKTGDCRLIQGTVAVRAHSGSALNERMDAWMHARTDAKAAEPASSRVRAKTRSSAGRLPDHCGQGADRLAAGVLAGASQAGFEATAFEKTCGSAMPPGKTAKVTHKFREQGCGYL
jgi:hypothetical protein